MFVFVLAAVFVVNDIYQASSQMQQFTLDIPAMKEMYTSSKIAKNQFTNQKYWNNSTFNSNNGTKYNLLVQLRDTESNSSGYVTVSNGSTHIFSDSWQKYSGRTYYVNLKSGTWTVNKTYTTGIWYISY